ncbi:hypothetical protein [Streptomyces sp. NPDC001070]
MHFADRPGTVQDTVTVGRPRGASGGVKIQQTGGNLSVVPDEAEALLTAGKPDRRLFDITTLAAMGYDDARTGGVPLIATWRGGVTAPAGSAAKRRLSGIDGAALRAGEAKGTHLLEGRRRRRSPGQVAGRAHREAVAGRPGGGGPRGVPAADQRPRRGWRATTAPGGRSPCTPGGFVPLRATASDGKGGTVDQEVIRAFGLS